MRQFKQPFPLPQSPQSAPLIETPALVWSMFMVFFGGMVLLAEVLIRL